VREATQTQQHLAHLEQIIVLQQRFSNDVAHELRTPLAAQCVVGETVLSRHAATSAQLRDAVVSMLEESQHMKRLIEGLLDLTRASLARAPQPGMSRERVTLDLRVLTRDCVESLQALAEEKQQRIAVSTSAEVLVAADVTMVRQALLNVLHNSIEHCPAGARIHVTAAPCSWGQALIRVRDDGPGIALPEQPHIFERFYRGTGTSRQRSLGLGLSIAKAILCSQGGGIQLRSTPGAGCCFLLWLPLVARADTGEEGVSAPA
jgi:two-component system OmpR family sensor kinase